eukprot:789490-Amphidinium_carterae.1
MQPANFKAEGYSYEDDKSSNSQPHACACASPLCARVSVVRVFLSPPSVGAYHGQRHIRSVYHSL